MFFDDADGMDSEGGTAAPAASPSEGDEDDSKGGEEMGNGAM